MTTYIQERNRLVHDRYHRCPTYGGRTIRCRIRVVENHWNTIVFATDLGDSMYSSITLHTEELATTVCDVYVIDRSHLLWIEHIPARHYLARKEDLYDLVHFNCDEAGIFSYPQWFPLTEEEVTLLTDGLLNASESV